MDGFVVWFTGLSGSGKSTLAAMLSAELRARGVRVEVLDGDEVRAHLSKGLGFSREDRDTNVRRIGFVAKLVARAGACAMTAAISPYEAIRDEQRAQIGRFVEIYCRCPLDALAARDPKGLYAKALAGEIRHFTGVDDPYEPPHHPELTLDTSRETREESLGRIVAKLEELGYVPRRELASVAFARAKSTRALPAPHGGELVRRIAPASARERLVEEARALPRVELSAEEAHAVSLLAVGAYSPLRGFMVEREYRRVVADARLENGLPWPIPVTLAVSEETAASARARGRVALVLGPAGGGAIVATLEVADAFRPDKRWEAEHVLGTSDRAHRRVAALEAKGPVYLGGEVTALGALEDHATLAGLPADPADVRARLGAAGFRDVVALATDRALDRADEHVTKTALESADALLVLALAEPGHDWPLSLAVRRRAHEALVARYYRADRVVLAARAGGRIAAPAREAVLDALVAKTFGASHVVFSPDHASEAGRESARSAFGVYAPSEIGITPLWFDDAFHSTFVGSTATDRTAPADPTARLAWSSATLATALARGEPPAPHEMRPEVAAIVSALGDADREPSR